MITLDMHCSDSKSLQLCYITVPQMQTVYTAAHEVRMFALLGLYAFCKGILGKCCHNMMALQVCDHRSYAVYTLLT